MEANKPCQVEDFKSLKLKPYRNFPRALLKAAIKELPDYATVVYLTLYDLAELNIRYPGTVVITHQALSQELDKSESSVRRAIETLKNLGFIELLQRNQQQNRWLPNIIRVCCPETLIHKIEAAEPNRKSTEALHRVPVLKPVVKTTEPLNQTETPKPLVTLYRDYQKNVKRLVETGSSPLLASKQAYQSFSKEEATSLQQFILGLPTKSKESSVSPPLPKMKEGCSKMNTIRSINNRDHDPLLTIEAQDPVDKLDTSSNIPTAKENPVVDFEKSAAVVHLLSEQDKTEAIRKIKAMARYHEIHSTIRLRYGNNLSRLISEVIFHIQHRDGQVFQSSKHALNACAKMLREGVWSTPKRLLQQTSLQLEQYSLRVKQQEQTDALNFCHTTKIDLAFRRINM